MDCRMKAMREKSQRLSKDEEGKEGRRAHLRPVCCFLRMARLQRVSREPRVRSRRRDIESGRGGSLDLSELEMNRSSTGLVLLLGVSEVCDATREEENELCFVRKPQDMEKGAYKIEFRYRERTNETCIRGRPVRDEAEESEGTSVNTLASQTSN